MRHKLKGRKLSRNTGHRNSLLKNLRAKKDQIMNLNYRYKKFRIKNT